VQFVQYTMQYWDEQQTYCREEEDAHIHNVEAAKYFSAGLLGVLRYIMLAENKAGIIEGVMPLQLFCQMVPDRATTQRQRSE